MWHQKNTEGSQFRRNRGPLSTTSDVSAVRKGNQLPATSSLVLRSDRLLRARRERPPAAPPSSVMKSRRWTRISRAPRTGLPYAVWQTGHTARQLGSGPKGIAVPAEPLKILDVSWSGIRAGEHDRNTTPNIGSMGGECGPLGRRHSGKGRAVPVRCPSIPVVS